MTGQEAENITFTSKLYTSPTPSLDKSLRLTVHQLLQLEKGEKSKVSMLVLIGFKWKLISDRRVLWRRQWQPTPVLLPGKSHEQRSL